MLSTLDCIAIKRIDNRDQDFRRPIGLGKFEDRLREDLKAQFILSSFKYIQYKSTQSRVPRLRD